jgi:hypothetical protein
MEMRRNVKLLAGSAIAAGMLVVASIGTAFAADPVTPLGGPRGPVAEAVDAVCQGIGQGFSNVVAALQKLTGLGQEQIVAERQAGKSPVQIAAENGVSEGALATEVISAKKDRLDEAVQAGRISQERAEFMLGNMTERVTESINRAEMGPRGPRGSGPALQREHRSAAGEPGLGAGPGMMNRWGGQGPAR